MQERREHNDQMASDIGYMKGLLEGLAGPEGRVTKLEKSAERQWWVSYVATPIVIVLSHTAKAFGVKI
jgi:hypothetical protein